MPSPDEQRDPGDLASALVRDLAGTNDEEKRRDLLESLLQLLDQVPDSPTSTKASRLDDTVQSIMYQCSEFIKSPEKLQLDGVVLALSACGERPDWGTY